MILEEEGTMCLWTLDTSDRMEDCHITEDLNLPVALIFSFCNLVLRLNASVELKVCDCYLAGGK
jgi:hypothetical protein